MLLALRRTALFSLPSSLFPLPCCFRCLLCAAFSSLLDLVFEFEHVGRILVFALVLARVSALVLDLGRVLGPGGVMSWGDL